MADKLVPVQIVQGTVITAHCPECDRSYTGNVGLRYIMKNGKKGVEVLIVHGNDMHPLVSIPCERIPEPEEIVH